MQDKQKKNSKNKYRRLRIFRFIVILIYSILAFFEKPFHCYKRTTFYTNKDKNDNKCNPDLVYLNGKFLDNTIYRSIEIAFLISFALLKIMYFKLKEIDIFKKIDLYAVIQYIIFFLIFICLIEVLLSIFLDYFPLINFFCRGILIILLIKSQRETWAIVLKIFYQTRVVTFLIFCVMVFFGTVGYFLFGDKSEDFKNVTISIYSLFILLSTCNFPDVMLGTFSDQNKFAFFYFLLYLAINYFILFTLLKTLYYSKFFDSLKKKARNAIEKVYGEFHENINDNIPEEKRERLFSEEQEENEGEDLDVKHITINPRLLRNISLAYPQESQTFNKLLFNLSKKFYLTKNDYIKILKLIGFDGRVSDFTGNDIFQLLNQRENGTKEEVQAIIQSNFILRFFSFKYTEIIINIVDFGIMLLLLVEIPDNKSNFILVFIPQIIWCSVLIFEFVLWVKFLTFKYIVTKEFVFFCFFIINSLTVILLFLSFFFLYENEDIYFTLFNLVRVLVSMRLIRIFVVFKKYNTFQTFYRTFHNMKKIFYSLFSTLFSFYYVFTTITMFLTGGHITNDIFEEDPTIPREYSYINFNDFGNGFISCFCLTMINNINIISKSLSVGVNQYFQGYFALFYFLSTLVILNISTTLLLEMYMSILAKMKEVKKKNKRNESVDEEITNME